MYILLLLLWVWLVVVVVVVMRRCGFISGSRGRLEGSVLMLGRGTHCKYKENKKVSALNLICLTYSVFVLMQRSLSSPHPSVE